MSNNASNEAATETGGNTPRRRMLLILLLVVLVALASATTWYLLYGRWYEGTDDAYVDGNIVQITPQTTGTVVSIGADDGDLVHAGQVLVKFDPSDADITLQQAEARLAHTVRKVRGLFATVDSYRAEVSARQVALQRTQSDFNRRRDLAQSGAISSEELAHARDALAAARSALARARQQLNSSKALIDDTTVASNPEVKDAEAQLRQAYLNDVRSTIVAPVTGYIAKRTVQVGQRVQPGTPLMAVVPLQQVWVDANFKETQLKEMRLGQPVTLESDLYGSDVPYHGTVESLGVGTGSAFSLLPAQNATGNWIKIVQRVPVRIKLDPEQLQKHPLRVGLSMTVSVNLHDQKGPMLAQTAPTRPVLETAVYQRQMADAQALIDRVLQANNTTAVARITHAQATR
ncbi:HlyD family secretion protein [Mangrovitalea sediminis]|uniref:HlyD family secretion protein n=1 Tax=Mangrovitalea sediminis TaxID=1982043 RepID=UPI000BE5D870|nr:HlyD family efflux transporter periplasmic adaptor subunit [Mangrovitalea sediminis]